jgi:malate dehydrogenase (oxaloacetate-decarboxylating)
MAIHDDVQKSFDLTRRWNTVPVITDGTAVLGLGDIGPEAGMPVMEGKCALFKAFGDVDAYPLCIASKDVDEIINAIKLFAGSFGGINLEDISAPRCFEIERRLKEELDIPVFHDDQHGTAIVTAAALLNALELAERKIEDIKVVINGAGAAGIAIAKFLMALGVKDIIMCASRGIICEGDDRINPAQQEIAKVTNRKLLKGTLADAMKDADVFVGVSAPGVVSEDMVRSMAKDAIVFPMANPTPEIMPDKALAAGARIVGTGRSDFPNQINNVLAFPGIFRGALDCRATCINEEMKVATSYALAALIPEDELNEQNIIPEALDPRVAPAVAKAVIKAAHDTGVARI